MSDKKNEVSVWKPAKHEAGSDLLPMHLAGGELLQVDERGREQIESRDLILPTLKCLTGTSDEVVRGMTGAKPGRFYMSGADQMFDAPLRLLLCAHTRSRALFPNPQDPKHKELETCLSRDSLRGTVYGLCEPCKYKDWGKDKGDKPACSESHNFVAITPYGPAVIRLSKSSFKNAKGFLTSWKISPYPLWRFPVLVTTQMETKELAGGRKQPYYVLDMRWQRSETVPQAAQEAAWMVHQQVMAAYNEGKFGYDAEDSPEE